MTTNVDLARTELEAVSLALGLLPLTPVDQERGGYHVRWWSIVDHYMSGARVPAWYRSAHEVDRVMACVRSGLEAVQRALEEAVDGEHQK